VFTAVSPLLAAEHADIDSQHVYTVVHIYKAWLTSLMMLHAAAAAAAVAALTLTSWTQPLHCLCLASPAETHTHTHTHTQTCPQHDTHLSHAAHSIQDPWSVATDVAHS